MLTLMPALRALIIGGTMRRGFTRRNFMPTRLKMLTCTPLISAENHSPSGNSENSAITTKTMITAITMETTLLGII